MQPRALLMLLGAAAVAVYLWLGPRLPKEQSVNVVLGDAAPRVVELSVQYASNGETAREAVFHWTPGSAPRVVHHAPSLPDGDWVVVTTVRMNDKTIERERRVTLQSSGSTSIEMGLP